MVVMIVFLSLFSTPGGNTISAAEHTCAMICAIARYGWVCVSWKLDGKAHTHFQSCRDPESGPIYTATLGYKNGYKN